MKTFGNCPLCGKNYSKRNRKTEHHILPKVWYHVEENCKVEVCQDCHQREFNHLYPMTTVWSKKQCINNWVLFCQSKGKNALELYPQILRLVIG